jgi:membrane-bound lytic murein transglycosylase D
MDNRTKTLFSCFVFTVASATAACSFNQQAKFQTLFLPPATHAAVSADDPEPPPIPAQPNLYLKDVAPNLLSAPPIPERRLRADALAQRAQRAFESGQKYYQAEDIDNARREFDVAVDLLLDASTQNPEDRLEYARKMDEMVDAIHRYDLAGMGAAAGVEEGKFEKAPLEDILQMTFPVDPKLKDKVREQVAATVSQLPLSVNDAVLGYINYFSNRGHKTVVAATERSGKYRAMVQRILDEEGVPQELIHLAQAESGFIPRAMSRAHAGGMWQFLTWRGQEYGLMQTRYTDDRMDPEKATRAAARHLHDLYNEFGDWYLAIAAYNCGPGVVEKAVERTGYADFWELRSRGVLPAETTNYVPIILAMTIMEKNAAEYGLDNLQMEPFLEYDTVEVSAPTSLALVSDILDTPMPELAALNPAVLKSIVPENFSLHIPKGSGNQFVAALQLIPAGHRDSWRVHRVEPGETLASIGKRFGVAPGTIMTANNLKSSEAAAGDRLVIPAALRVSAPVRRMAARSTAASLRKVGTARHSAKRKAAPARTATLVKPASKPPVILAHNSVSH